MGKDRTDNLGGPRAEGRRQRCWPFDQSEQWDRARVTVCLKARKRRIVVCVRLTRCAAPAGDPPTGRAMLKRAAMRTGTQINGFLSSEERPAACE